MGRMGTSQVAVRELAVRFQSQCGSGSIPAMCCILLWMSHSALDPEGAQDHAQLPKSEPVALAHNRIPARVLSTSLTATARQAVQMMCQRRWPQSPCPQYIVAVDRTNIVRIPLWPRECLPGSSGSLNSQAVGKALESQLASPEYQTVPCPLSAQYQEKGTLHTKERGGIVKVNRSRGRRELSQAPERGEA